MKNTKRIITGLLFAATLSLSQMANGGDAYAMVEDAGAQTHSGGGGVTLPLPLPAPAPDLLQLLGITWE